MGGLNFGVCIAHYFTRTFGSRLRRHFEGYLGRIFGFLGSRLGERTAAVLGIGDYLHGAIIQSHIVWMEEWRDWDRPCCVKDGDCTIEARRSGAVWFGGKSAALEKDININAIFAFLVTFWCMKEMTRRRRKAYCDANGWRVALRGGVERLFKQRE